MTLGIVAHGPQAGAAVRQAALAAELMGRGEIGGFVVFAVMDARGQVQHCWGQQGGITALHIPSAWLAAPQAALITSGPDRPEPLLQFLPGRDGVGLVTGHRLPNRPSLQRHEPLNQCVLALLAAGLHPQAAVDQVLAAYPEADAGLIAITPHGEMGCANSARVQRRTDLGAGRGSDVQAGYAFIHNSIAPPSDVQNAVDNFLRQGLRLNAVDSARTQMLQLHDTVSITAAPVDAVHVDAQWRVLRVESADPFVLQARQSITLLPLAMQVLQQGQAVGQMATELFAQVAQGRAQPSPQEIANLALVSVKP